MAHFIPKTLQKVGYFCSSIMHLALDEMGVKSANLSSQAVILLLVISRQRVPPLPKDLGHGTIVLVWMVLVHERPMAFREDHERIHRAADGWSFGLGGEERMLHTLIGY